jgi:hypothetical protein
MGAAQQLAGADMASPVSDSAFDSILGLARRLISMPLGVAFVPSGKDYGEGTILPR